MSLFLLMISFIVLSAKDINEKEKSLVTKSMADKVAKYMQNNFNSTTAEFNQANDLTDAVEIKKIIYNIHDHYDCVEKFIIRMFVLNGVQGGWICLKSVGLSPDECNIAETIYKESPVGKDIETRKNDSTKEPTSILESNNSIPKEEVAPEFLPCTYKKKKKTIKNPGGSDGVTQYFMDNVIYPEEAWEQGIQGRVFVVFTIDVDGSITNVKVKKAVNPLLDKEAIRVVSSMPKWKPGTQDGKPVRVNMTVCIPFKQAP